MKKISKHITVYFDDIEVVCKELKISLDKNTKIKVEVEPLNDESSFIADIIVSEKQVNKK